MNFNRKLSASDPLSSSTSLTVNFSHNYLSCLSDVRPLILTTTSNTELYMVSLSSLPKLTLYKKLQIPTTFYYLVDAAQFCSEISATIYYNFTTLLTDKRELIIVGASAQFLDIPSLSSILPGATWLERELSDFSGITFSGLTDTRALLLDYLEVKRPQLTHTQKATSYQNFVYEVKISY